MKSFFVKLIFVFMFFLTAWMIQEENQLWDLTRNELKKANNFAAHDAAQQIDQVELSQGFLVIDPVAARTVFEETLRINLGLNNFLDPMPGSPVHSSVRIVHFEIIDDRNAVFPYLYDNPTFRVSKNLNGPAVISVIETDHLKVISFTPFAQPIQVPTIAEYKPNR